MTFVNDAIAASCAQYTWAAQRRLEEAAKLMDYAIEKCAPDASRLRSRGVLYAAILSHARPAWNRKVAMIVGLTMGDPSLRVPGLPDLFYAQRVKALVARGALAAVGNLDHMRYSEVRLPSESGR